MLITLLRKAFLASCATVLLGSSAQAATQLDRTRLIVTQTESRAVIQVHSEHAQPLLLQAWVDDGQTHRTHAVLASSVVPFITDPPVVRLDPGQSRSIQTLLTASPDTLPADRESLYWFNVLQIPTTSPGETEQHLHLTVQTRLKLFYRPSAIVRYNAAALPAAERLRFALERDPNGQIYLQVYNPAPIHQTLASLALALPQAAPSDTPLTLDAPMLAPFATQRLALPETLAKLPANATVRLSFATIDDNGNAINDEQTLRESL